MGLRIDTATVSRSRVGTDGDVCGRQRIPGRNTAAEEAGRVSAHSAVADLQDSHAVEDTAAIEGGLIAADSAFGDRQPAKVVDTAAAAISGLVTANDAVG